MKVLVGLSLGENDTEGSGVGAQVCLLLAAPLPGDFVPSPGVFVPFPDDFVSFPGDFDPFPFPGLLVFDP